MKKIILILLFASSISAYAEKNDDSFYQSILNNDLAMVKEKLENGINPNSNFPSGFSLLYGATIMGSTEVAGLLISKGAKAGEEELEAAIGNEHPKILEFILNSGVNPNYYTKEGVTPLILAANRGNSKVINILLNYGALKETKSKNGETALDVVKKRKEQYVNAINALK